MIKYILVDVHGVLTSGDERKFFLSKMEKEYGINSEQHNSLWLNHIDNFNVGLETAADYLKIFNQIFNTNISVDKYFEIFIDQIKPNIELLKKLESFKDYQIFIVSDNLVNLSKGLGKVLGNTFEKYPKFYSFEFGLTKTKGLLKIVLDKLKANPSECLFIDDSPKNIQVAKDLGINGLLFENNQKLFAELNSFLN
jgi:putative hydrolase of the HAD superfamily